MGWGDDLLISWQGVGHLCTHIYLDGWIEHVGGIVFAFGASCEERVG